MKISRSTGATLAGCALVMAGAGLLWRAFPFWRHIDSTVLRVTLPLLGVVAGLAKGVFVLRRTGRRMVARLEGLPEPFWIWKTYPVSFYPFIALMISAGVMVRFEFGKSAPGFVACLYVGIGFALFAGSAPYFRAGHAARGGTSEEAVGVEDASNRPPGQSG